LALSPPANPSANTPNATAAADFAAGRSDFQALLPSCSATTARTSINSRPSAILSNDGFSGVAAWAE
jgi:hypothetical protein